MNGTMHSLFPGFGISLIPTPTPEPRTAERAKEGSMILGRFFMDSKQAVAGELAVAQRQVAVLRWRSGHALVSQLAELAGPTSLLVIPAESRVPVVLGRGHHEIDILLLGQPWCDLFASVTQTQLVGMLAKDALPVHFFNRAIDHDSPSLPEILGWVLVAKHQAGVCNNLDLTFLSQSFPGPLDTLIRSVRREPMSNWGLKAASNAVGYSSFHLSRTFRQVAQYGFPEFVERCRTQYTLRRLLAGDCVGLDELAHQAGFSAAQVMRDCMLKYVGFHPNELLPKG